MFVASFSLASAEDAVAKSPAEELISLMDTESSAMAVAKAAFAPYLQQLKAQGYTDEAVKEVEAAADAYFGQVFSDPQLNKEMAELYSREFTEVELKELIAFYQTPLGKKTLRSLPQLMQQGALLGEKYAQKYAEDFQKNLEGIMLKHAPK